MLLHFYKMNGAGNDFVVIDNRDLSLELTRERIELLCDRHRGVGADGLLAVEPAENGADFKFRYYNADGGEAEMCGNGARCFGRFTAALMDEMPESVSFETIAGTLSAELVVVTVDEAGRNSSAILDHVSRLAATAEVPVTTLALSDGRPPFEILLHAIDVHGADLAVMGRSDLRSTGRPYVGSQTEHLLEFTPIPVVVVPGV